VWLFTFLCCSASFRFYPRDAMLARVIVIATCLSVCPSRAGIVSKRRKLAACSYLKGSRDTVQSCGDMPVPQTRTQFGRRSFRVVAPAVWNVSPPLRLFRAGFYIDWNRWAYVRPVEKNSAYVQPLPDVYMSYFTIIRTIALILIYNLLNPKNDAVHAIWCKPHSKRSTNISFPMQLEL